MTTKAQLLAAFLGRSSAYDAETVAYWRTASAAAHAQAMIELAEYAERIAAQTGLRKDPADMFPGFAAFSGRA